MPAAKQQAAVALHSADMAPRPIKTAHSGTSAMARDLFGTRVVKSGDAVTSSRLSTMQRANGACCQSMRAVRRVRAASSIPFAGTSTTGALPATVAARRRSLVSNTRFSSTQRRASARSGNPPSAMTQPSAEVAQHLVAQKPRQRLDPKLVMPSPYITVISSVSIKAQAIRVVEGRFGVHCPTRFYLFEFT